MPFLLGKIRRAIRLYKFTKLRLSVNFGPDQTLLGKPKAAVIVLSYKRPQNIELIVRSALKNRFVDRVIVSNNNPEIDLDKWMNISDERLKLVQQEKQVRPVIRFEIARDLPHQSFICIDDDIFLRPNQIKCLYAALLDDPSVPHGLFGQVQETVETRGSTVPTMIGGRTRFEGPVDILNCVYAFTKEHVEQFFFLLRLIGKSDPKDLKRGDDIVLSFAGAGKPMCHDFGAILKCSTSQHPDIAVWKQPGFNAYRAEVFATLQTWAESASRR